jgi:hypothetical protein
MGKRRQLKRGRKEQKRAKRSRSTSSRRGSPLPLLKTLSLNSQRKTRWTSLLLMSLYQLNPRSEARSKSTWLRIVNRQIKLKRNRESHLHLKNL